MSLLQPQPPFHRTTSFQPTSTEVDIPTFISEAEYWESYYEDPDHHYEWNNGYLEEKGTSDKGFQINKLSRGFSRNAIKLRNKSREGIKIAVD